MTQTAMKSILLYTVHKSVLHCIIYCNTLLFELNDGPLKGSCILTLCHYFMYNRTGCF